MRLEKYIKDLSPELKEKARKCVSVDELAALAKAEQVELPTEAMEAIAGGTEQNPENCGRQKCVYCGSANVKFKGDEPFGLGYKEHWHCNDCGRDFTVTHYE